MANPQHDRAFLTMARAPLVRNVAAMAADPRNRTTDGSATLLVTVFADLRKRNAYRARVARMLEGKRTRHVDRVIQAQRKRRVHQSR